MCSTTKSKLHLTWLEVWWSLGSYQSMFHHAMRGDTLSHSIETIYDLWWSFGLTHPCSTTLWAPDHSTSIIMRQCKDKGHVSHPQEKPQSTSTGGRGGRGSRWVHYIGGGVGGACQTWIIYIYIYILWCFYWRWKVDIALGPKILQYVHNNNNHHHHQASLSQTSHPFSTETTAAAAAAAAAAATTLANSYAHKVELGRRWKFMGILATPPKATPPRNKALLLRAYNHWIGFP